MKNLEDKFEGKPLVEASIRQTLGETYRKLGDYEAARPHLERAYEIRRAQLGEDDTTTLTSMNQLGWLYFLQTRYDQAEPLLVKAMETRQRLLGEEHADTLESMTRVATLYFYQGRAATKFSELEGLFTKSFETARRVLGEEHPVTLEAMGGFVEFCSVLASDMGGIDQVEPLCDRGLEISRRVLGEEHETTLHFAICLALVYRAQGRYDEALPMAMKVLETSQHVLGEKHPVTLEAMCAVGRLYQSQGRCDEAEPLLEKAVQYATQACELTKWKDLNSIDTLAAAYAEAGDFKSAVKWQMKAIDLASGPLQATFESRIELYESGEPCHISPWRGNAGELIAVGHYQRAERILLSARATSARLLGEQHEETLTCINELIKLYEVWGKPEQADKWRVSLSNKEQANE